MSNACSATQLAIPVIGVVPHARAATSSTVLAVADASSVEDQIKQDIAYNCELLRSWQRRQEGENVLKNLNLLIQKVGNRQLDGTQRSDTFAELYRCLGGAYLITSGVPDNMRRALPHLTRSLELNPKQTLLEENIKTFENFLAARKGDVRLLFTTELQVLRGSDDPEIPGIADGMARYALGRNFGRSTGYWTTPLRPQFVARSRNFRRGSRMSRILSLRSMLAAKNLIMALSP